MSDEAGNSGENYTSNRSVGLEDTEYATNQIPHSINLTLVVKVLTSQRALAMPACIVSVVIEVTQA